MWKQKWEMASVLAFNMPVVRESDVHRAYLSSLCSPTPSSFPYMPPLLTAAPSTPIFLKPLKIWRR